ncbi:hypothetical protein BDV96DRAFT_489286 [Lophiotrema nucula]|uniref:Short chain dehydrogenase/reductase n=1 Tax=Lophiotrema nucula TaxID=690887 RepID=A0A6A5ZFM7_9PLEO|nr:hypothetical protein BDV96DRAFT_489286 [Lophiotrema nucula]
MAASAAKTIVLITGANSGVGFELAAQLLAKESYHVLLGARSTQKGNTALQDLQSRKLPGSVEFLEIDATKDDTIERAAKSVEQNHGHLDVLVNNAAIAAMEGPLRQEMRDAFDTNATGPLIIGQTFLPLLQAAVSKSTAKAVPSPRVINVHSGAGSIARRLEPSSMMYKMKGGFGYRTSKAALSMVTACQFVEYGDVGVKVFAYDPGFTVSNLGPHNNVEQGARSAEESVRPLVDLIEGKRDDEAGKILHNTGGWPW